MLSVKTVFYKFCFCLGLGTASYYAYAQVQHWAKGDVAPAEHSTSAFADKVQALTRDEVIEVAKRHRAEMEGVAHARRSAHPAIKPIKPLAVVAAVSPTPAPSVDPSPSVSPSPTETAQNAEATPGAPLPEAMLPNGMMAPNGMMPYGMVMGPDGQLYPAMAGTEGPSPASTSTDASTADAANGNMGMPAGFNAYTGQNGTSYGSSSSGGSIVSGVSTGSSVLTSQDLATLTSAPVQAAFQDQQNQVNGYMCGSNDQSSCTYQSGVSVHSLRWDTTDGLEKNVNFAVQASSGSTPVQFNVSFKVQDRLLNDQLVTFNAQPNQVSVHSETRDSKSYKVYQFKMPDTQVQGDDQLSQMQATLVYEVTEDGMEMTADSNFSFSRSQVKTNSETWDPSQPQEDSSQNELYFIADELPYSMTLQKSQ